MLQYVMKIDSKLHFPALEILDVIMQYAERHQAYSSHSHGVGSAPSILRRDPKPNEAAMENILEAGKQDFPDGERLEG